METFVRLCGDILLENLQSFQLYSQFNYALQDVRANQLIPARSMAG